MRLQSRLVRLPDFDVIVSCYSCRECGTIISTIIDDMALTESCRLGLCRCLEWLRIGFSEGYLGRKLRIHAGKIILRPPASACQYQALAFCNMTTLPERLCFLLIYSTDAVALFILELISATCQTTEL
jgi:hypothetical protein